MRFLLTPTKPPSEVVIPETSTEPAIIPPSIFSCVIDPIPPITLIAVVAVPVKSPTKPPVDVVTPVAFMFSIVTLPRVLTPLTDNPVISTIPPITLIAVSCGSC